MVMMIRCLQCGHIFSEKEIVLDRNTWFECCPKCGNSVGLMNIYMEEEDHVGKNAAGASRKRVSSGR